MLEHHAMRYLLARQLWALRRAVPKAMYEEVTASLTLSRDGENYSIAWRRGGVDFARTAPRSEYVFYRKGDRDDSEGVVETFERQNVARARALAAEILGTDAAKAGGDRAPRLDYRDYASLGWMLALCVSAAAIDRDALWPCAAFFAVFAVEFAPRYGRLLATAAALAIPFAGWALTGVAAGGFLAVSHFLDPNRNLRSVRMAMGAVAAAAGLSLFVAHGPVLENVALALAAAPVMAFVTLFRWTLGSHFRVAPLLAPLAAPAIILDGSLLAGLVFAGGSMAALAAGMFGWRLMPHPPGATHQGVSASTWQ